MIRKIMLAVAALMFACQLSAQSTMYLVKDNHVVGKYASGTVDYITFDLPEGVIDGSLVLDVVSASKNSVTYTVTPIEKGMMYCHGILLKEAVNLVAVSYYGTELDKLSEEEFNDCILNCFLMNLGTAYAGEGAKSYTQTDYVSDGYGMMDVVSGADYYAVAFPIDEEYTPVGDYYYKEFSTKPSGVSAGTFEVKYLGQNGDGCEFEFQASSDIVHIYTAFGVKSSMEQYVATFGYNVLFVVAGNWPRDVLLDTSGDPNVWDVYGESGEYVMYAIAVDRDGNQIRREVTATYVSDKVEGPKINILSKSKGNGNVSVNFEITPSNVSEAYVRLMKENDFDNMVNDGWYPYEIASTRDATDIYNEIRSTGEYTFTASSLGDEWYALIIYARDNDGNRTVAEIAFNMLPDSEWAIFNPVKKQAKAPAQVKSVDAARRLTVGGHRESVKSIVTF